MVHNTKAKHFLYLKKINHQGIVSKVWRFFSQFYSFNLPFFSNKLSS